jgi:hypothetical protein
VASYQFIINRKYGLRVINLVFRVWLQQFIHRPYQNAANEQLQNIKNVGGMEINIFKNVSINFHDCPVGCQLFLNLIEIIYLNFSPLLMSRHGRYEETPLCATREWPYVPSNANGDWEIIKVLLNLLCMLWEIRLDGKGNNRIYHIITHSWHTVTRIWTIMGFS